MDQLFGEKGIRMQSVGWYHCRNMWLRALGMLPQFPADWEMAGENTADQEHGGRSESGYNTEEVLMSSDEEAMDDDLLQQVEHWKSPKTILDEDE